MNVRTIEVFSQDVADGPDGRRFFTLRAEFLGFLNRTGPPDVLRLDWGGGVLDVPFPEFLTDGARLAGGAVGWPAPGGAVV